MCRYVMAVLRCLNLSMLLRRRAVSADFTTSLAASLTGTYSADRLRPFTEQLARAYAAACIIYRIRASAYMVVLIW